ncbi:MAG TPA: glycosyltransferase family 39 protein, partial [Pyrinomonadaceae bacterium]|nr:glycosyltransferase family 39 protein [Pyrinomonadaceae bacterium]
MDTEKIGSEAELVNEGEQPRDYVWLIGCAVVTAIAAILRFAWLGLKPLHHDEGVNGFFLTNLVRDGNYHYDPANYHGPTLYYLAYPFVKLFGLETVPIRASVAVFGVLSVILVLFLRRYLGRNGSLLGALFLALSPGMVFISRYFIHEIFFVFLGLALVVSVLFFIEKRRAGPFATVWMVLILLVCFLPSSLTLATYIGGENLTLAWVLRIVFFLIESVLVYFVVRMILAWDEGRPIYLMLASASVALLFATKETAFITLGTMLIACVSVWIWRSIRQSEFFEKNVFSIAMGLNALLVVAALVYRSTLGDAWKWLNDNFYIPSRPPENFVFYSIIFLVVAAVAAWVIFLIDLRQANETGFGEPVEATLTNFRQGLGKRTDLILAIAAVATIFVYLSILFFTSFFTYAEGIGKAFEAYAIWTRTGSKDHTQNGVFAYLKWGMKVESPILILSALGALVALMRGKHRFAIFTAFWAFGLFAAYILIPYKTPWLALSYLMPMCIVAGYGIGE